MPQVKQLCVSQLFDWVKGQSMVQCETMPDFVDMFSLRE